MQSLEYYLLLPYSVTVAPEECSDGTRCYVARVTELEGCESHGDSPEEALTSLGEAKALYLRTMLEDGIEPPLPSSFGYAETVGGAFSTIWRVEEGVDNGAEPFRMQVPSVEEREPAFLI